jgi:hypothetical protein
MLLTRGHHAHRVSLLTPHPPVVHCCLCTCCCLPPTSQALNVLSYMAPPDQFRWVKRECRHTTWWCDLLHTQIACQEASLYVEGMLTVVMYLDLNTQASPCCPCCAAGLQQHLPMSHQLHWGMGGAQHVQLHWRMVSMAWSVMTGHLCASFSCTHA